MNIESSANYRLENKYFLSQLVLKTLLIIAGSALLFGLAANYFYAKERARVIDNFQSEGVTRTEHHKQIIAHEFDLILQNLLYLKEQAQFQGAFDKEGGTNHAEEDLLLYMKSASVLDQVRVLDNAGQEIIRVNRVGNEAEVVPEDRLQKKSNRYYVHEIMKLSQGEVYISKLDLNKEFGKVERPFKPVVRLGMAVFDQTGNRKGSLILNYLAADLLNILKQSGVSSSGDMLLINEDGYYLSAPDSEKTWGFMIEGRASQSLAIEAPEVWRKIVGGDKGHIISGNNLYAFTSIYPYKEIKIANTQQHDFLTKQVWKIVSYYGEPHIEAAMASYRKSMTQWTYIFGVAIFLIAWPLSYLLERRRLLNEHLILLSSAVEHTGESVCVTDSKGVIEYVNPAFSRLTGYTKKEAVGRRPADLLKSTAQSGSFYTEMWQTITRGEVWHGKLVDKRKDGSFFPTAMSISPVQNGKGVITHYISIQSDESLSKLLVERELREQKMKTLATAVGGIAHEFNNILAGMLGNTFLVKMKENGNHDIVSKLETIEQLGQNAAYMVHQMMTYAGNDIHTPNIESVDVNRVCREAVSAYEGQQTFECKFTESEGSVVIDGESTRLSTALSNLLSNAAEAVKNLDDGLVEVDVAKVKIESETAQKFSVRLDQDYVRIQVADNGSGVLKEHQEVIFEPFFTTKDVGEGTGLGLSAVYGIVKDHHGFIQLDYEREQGSCFQLYLPLKQ